MNIGQTITALFLSASLCTAPVAACTNHLVDPRALTNHEKLKVGIAYVAACSGMYLFGSGAYCGLTKGMGNAVVAKIIAGLSLFYAGETLLEKVLDGRQESRYTC